MSQQSPPLDEVTYCEVHPTKETSLRCNKCGRLMCADCAVSTPVGYRCKQCVRQHEDRFFTATQNDYVIVAAICVALSVVGGFLASLVGFIILVVIASIPVGGFIAEVALRAVQRRRGRYSGQVGAAAVVVGGFMGGLAQNYSAVSSALRQATAQFPADQVPDIPIPFDLIVQTTFSDIGLLIFIGLAAYFVYSRCRLGA